MAATITGLRASSPGMIELKDIARRYRTGGQAVNALDGVDLTIEADAEGIIAMLARWGMDWGHVDSAWGDKTTTDSTVTKAG